MIHSKPIRQLPDVAIKRFGQHFLKDPNILRKIVDEINPLPDDLIIEIGPGYGALTKDLLSKVKKLTAIEIDRNAAGYLKEHFSDLDIINEDILNTELNKLIEGKNKLRVVGNIPYNLTSPILFKLIENIDIVNDAVFMVQYEVAKRITAQKSTKDYGILSVLLRYFGRSKLCFKISPNVFYPKPKVFSALIHIYFQPQNISTEEKKLFISVVKACFGNRRKILKNSLSNSIFNKIDFSLSGIDLSLRAENLDVKDFETLTKFVLNNYGHSVFLDK